MIARVVLVGLAAVAACGRIGFGSVSPRDGDPDGVAPVDAAGCIADPCPSFATFCHSFETTMAIPGNPPWNDVQLVNYSGGAVDPASRLAIVDTPSCDGKALDVDIMGATQWGQIFKNLAPRRNPTFLRAMMYVPSTNPAFGVDTFGVGDLSSQYLLITVQADGSIGVHSSQAITGTSAGPVIVHDRWQCIEMAVTFSPNPTGHATVWVDGAQVIDVAGTTESGATLDELVIGISTGPPTAGLTTVFFDDVALAAQRIGCT